MAIIKTQRNYHLDFGQSPLWLNIHIGQNSQYSCI